MEPELDIKYTASGRKRLECNGSTIEALDKLHTLSMSSDPIEAAFGRGLKQMLPAFENWAHAERERGTEPATLCHVSVNILAQLLQILCTNLAIPGTSHVLLQMLTARIDDCLQDHIEVLREERTNEQS